MKKPLLQYLGWFLLLYSGSLFVQRNLDDLLSGNRDLHHNDFRHMYVAGCVLQSRGNFYDDTTLLTEAARRGVNRLNPYVYPPLLAVLMYPLSFLRFESAGMLWYGINLLFALASGILFSRILSSKDSPWHLVCPALLLATSEPLTRTLTAGQLNLMLLFLLSASWVLLSRERDIWGGIALGLAAAVKIFPALLIVYLFWRRKWRAAWAALLSAIVLTLIPAAIVGFRVSWDYVSLLRQMSYGSSTWSHLGQQYHIDPANQAPAALITRLLSINPQMGLYGFANLPGLARLLSTATGIILLGAGFILCRTRKETSHMQMEKLGFGLFLLLALLVPSLMWDHYLVIALLSAVLFLSALKENHRLGGILLLCAFSIYLMNITYHFWNPFFSRGWGIPLASVKLAGALILLVLMMREILQQSMNESS